MQEEEFPTTLPPLMFVMKTLLRERGLHSPANGHLGGYALLNMVHTSLNPEHTPSILSLLVLSPTSCAFTHALVPFVRLWVLQSRLPTLTALLFISARNLELKPRFSSLAIAQVVAHLRQQELYGEPQNLGALLLSFLRKFGWEYDYNRMAISLEENDSTGELYQHEAWWLNAHLHQSGLSAAYSRRELPLHIQDPLQPTNDIGRPTHDMRAVRTMFRETHAALVAPRGAFHVALSLYFDHHT
jgi:DNA polymerase sigma